MIWKGESPMLPRRIEEISLNSWPALQQILFDGWILRFSEGYSKRANSVNPLYSSNMDVEQKVDTCEKLYAGKGLQTIFRLTPFSLPRGLDQVLESRNYTKVAPTSVLHLDLDNNAIQPAPPEDLREERLDDWMEFFCRFSGSAVEQHRAHKAILQAIASRRFLASLVDSGEAVACGLGVLENGYLGLFDLVTHPERRNHGYGTRLVRSLLRWAQERGAVRAYLQVVQRNTAGRRLYRKLGFREVHEYWYRVLDG